MYKTLIFSYYIDPNKQRDNELIYCFKKNLQAGFDSIIVFSEVDAEIMYNNLGLEAFNNHKGKIFFKKVDCRPTYNDFFEASKLDFFNDKPNKLFFVSNTDIYFEDLYKVENFYDLVSDKQNTVLALSRWDVQSDGSIKYIDRLDCQDAWIFYNSIDFRLSENFTMGIAGCDNRLAYELYRQNYNILNPSDTIKIYHYHLSNVRRYINDSEIHEAFVSKESKRINGPYYLLCQYEKLLRNTDKKKVISFSLYGNDAKYCIGAIENVKLAKHIYPEWICRFYVSKEVDIKYIEQLRNHDNCEIILMNEFGNNNSKFWRFLPISDHTVDIMISRDTDSRLCMREKYAVDDWLSTDKGFHIMKDHPYHYARIMAGMFGAKKDSVPNFAKLLKNYNKTNQHESDQFFLEDIVFPLIKNNCIVHDEFMEKKCFPTLRSSNKKFVGEIYDENNIRNQEHYKLIP